MPVFKVGVERTVRSKVFLYVRADTEALAEGRAAAYAAEEVADDDMKCFESEDDVNSLGEVPPHDLPLVGGVIS